MKPTTIHDPFITGAVIDLEMPKAQCEACGADWQPGVEIDKVTLPQGIKPSKQLIAFRTDLKPLKYLGIACGCYAKFHRQIAHIQSSKK